LASRAALQPQIYAHPTIAQTHAPTDALVDAPVYAPVEHREPPRAVYAPVEHREPPRAAADAVTMLIHAAADAVYE